MSAWLREVEEQQLDGLLEWLSGRGQQGTVPSPPGISSFRSVSPPCLTSPGLAMQ